LERSGGDVGGGFGGVSSVDKKKRERGGEEKEVCIDGKRLEGMRNVRNGSQKRVLRVEQR